MSTRRFSFGAVCAVLAVNLLARGSGANDPTEAPAAFDNVTNGFLSRIDFEKAETNSWKRNGRMWTLDQCTTREAALPVIRIRSLEASAR